MALITDHILTWVTFLPLIGALVILLALRRPNAARVAALITALLDLTLTLYLWLNFDAGRGDDQFIEQVGNLEMANDDSPLAESP